MVGLPLGTAVEDAVERVKAPARVPRHVGIIMDGNGRWAKARGLTRSEGHRRGVEAVRRLLRSAQDTGIRYVTLYSFSSENWARPPAEVRDLMNLLRFFIRTDLNDLKKNGVRVRIIGGREKLEPDILSLIEQAERETCDNRRLNLLVAFNYGGRDEVARAVRNICADVAAGRIGPREVDEATISRALDTGDIPDPDLIIRTSGEQRLSNFLLWQAAYAELFFTPVMWPDFDARCLEEALEEYARRERRLGGIGGG